MVKFFIQKWGCGDEKDKYIFDDIDACYDGSCYLVNLETDLVDVFNYVRFDVYRDDGNSIVY